MAEKFSLDDILEEYASKAKNSREKSDFDVERLLENPLSHKKAYEDILKGYDNSDKTDVLTNEKKEYQSAPTTSDDGTTEDVKPYAEADIEREVEKAETVGTSDDKAQKDNEPTEDNKVIRQGNIESVDIDTLVESAVDGVETTDEPIEKKQSDMDIRLDPITSVPDKSDNDDENPDADKAIYEDEKTRVIASIVNGDDNSPVENEEENKDVKKASRRENVHDEEQRLQKEGFDAGLNSRFRLRKTSGNTAIIEGLMKLKRERKPVSKEVEVTPVKRLRIKDVDLNLGGKIIPKTEQFDKIEEPLTFPENATDTMKMNILSERRKNRIKNFVLRTNDRDDEETENKVKNTIGDFDDYKQAHKVLSDIVGLKSNLTVRLCVLLLTTVFSCYIAAANDFGWPILELFKRTSDSSFVFVNIILGLISAFVSYTVITAGFKKLIKRNADCDSIAAISIVSAVLVSILVLFDSSIMQTKAYNLYMSVAILGLLFNTLGKLLIVNRTLRNFRYVAGEFDKYAINSVANEDTAVKFTKGSINDFPELAAMRKTEFNEDFLKNSYSTDAADRFCKTYAPLILIVSLIIGLLALVCDRNAVGFMGRMMAALITFSGAISMVSSFTLMLIVNLPLSRASKKFLQSSAVMLGYSAVEDFSDTNSILVDACQLFPEGMVNLVNLKSMSATSIEECILMAASLACQSGSVMNQTFYNMLKGKTEMLYPVESYIFEDGLGLSGWIENKRVLLGTRELMKNHSIEGLPTREREAEYTRGYIPVYLSIGGVVSALFVIQVNASISVKNWLLSLEKDKVITVIRTVDGFISLGFLASLFDIQPDSIKLLPFRFHEEYEKETSYTERANSSMLCSGHFPSFAMLISGSKKLQILANLGVFITMGGSLLGAFIAFVMTVFGTFSGLTATLVMGYNLLLLAITVLSSYIKRF